MGFSRQEYWNVASEIVERRGETITRVSVSADDEKVIVTCK